MYYLDEVKQLRSKLNARRKAGEHAKCVFLGEKLLQLHKKNKNTQSMNFADDLFNLAMVYEDMGKLERAKMMYVESLRVTEFMYGQDVEYADRLTNLAIVYGKMGKDVLALGMFSRAENIIRTKLGPESLEVSNALQNVANCMFDQKMYKRALEEHKLALRIRERDKGIAYADSLNACGYCCEAMEQDEQAEDYFLRALNVTRDIVSECSEEYASGLMYYAGFLCGRGLVKPAVRWYNKAHGIYKRMYAEKPMTLAAAINSIADGIEKAGDVKKALLLRIGAIDIMKSIVGGNHLQFANNYRDIATGYHSLGVSDKAIQYLRKTMKIKESIIGRMNDSYVKDLLTLALYYLELADYRRMAAMLKQVLKDVDFDSEETPTYYKGLRELYFLINEMVKLHDSMGGNFIARPLSGDMKKIEALMELFKAIGDNMGGLTQI